MKKPPQTNYKCELLDPNHTHFVLVDDSKHDFGGEVIFRSDLESGLRKMFNIKTVVLVLGGGLRTVRFVYESVVDKTPCVFLEVSLIF